MKNTPLRPSGSIGVFTPALLLGVLFLDAQSKIDMTGYWAFHVKDRKLHRAYVPSPTPQNPPTGETPPQAHDTVYDGTMANANRVDSTLTTTGRDPLEGWLERWEMNYPDLKAVKDFGSEKVEPATRTATLSLNTQ
jgi:hypothetical protein